MVIDEIVGSLLFPGCSWDLRECADPERISAFARYFPGFSPCFPGERRLYPRSFNETEQEARPYST